MTTNPAAAEPTSTTVLAPPRTISLLSIPSSHPYVDAVRPRSARLVAADRVSGFAPDPFFRPAGVAEWGGQADVVHLHFGFDHLGRTDARRWLAALAAAGLPLVLTVHDLRNPHHDTRHQHDALLSEIVPAAAALVTLTERAAAEIADRFSRRSEVLPHPSLVDAARTAHLVTEPGLVVLHLKSLRRNLVEPLALVEAAAAGAVRGGGRLRVDLHPEVAGDPRLAGLVERPPAGAEVVVHDRFSDAELEGYLRRAQVTVLPHRWGTHSGWLELARDLGTRVVAPDCGFYTDQWSEVVSYPNNEERGLDSAGLADAVAAALALPILAPADPTTRRMEAVTIRRAHERIYRSVRGSGHR